MRSGAVLAALRVLVIRRDPDPLLAARLDAIVESYVDRVRDAMAARGQPVRLETMGAPALQAAATARASARLPADADLAALAGLLTDPDHHLRTAAAVAIGRRGPDAESLLPRLLGLIAWPDRAAVAPPPLPDGLRGYAYEAITAVAPTHPAAVRGLMLRLDLPDPIDRRDAALRLGQLGTVAAPAVARLCQLTTDHDVAVAGDAITALGMIGIDSPGARHVLGRLAAHADPRIAERARVARQQLRHPFDPKAAAK